LEVTEERAQKVLAKLNPHKAPGPDNLSNWIFKEYSYILALPVMKIINASYYEQQLSTIWKKANVSPLPQKKPLTILEKDLRPISMCFIITTIIKLLNILRTFDLNLCLVILVVFSEYQWKARFTLRKITQVRCKLTLTNARFLKYKKACLGFQQG
jgi:hypothetical protein